MAAPEIRVKSGTGLLVISQAEFDALTVKDPETFYLVYD